MGKESEETEGKECVETAENERLVAVQKGAIGRLSLNTEFISSGKNPILRNY